MRSEEGVRFERVSGALGARVHGVDVREPLSEERAALLRDALHEHGVLFFESGRMLERDEFVAFVKSFGDLEEYAFAGGNELDGVIDDEKNPMADFRTNCWHTDGSALESPPQFALLTPVELPEPGGDTLWASMYAAWEALSPRIQSLLEGLQALHSTIRLPFLGPYRSTVHPIVLRDPVTGRKALYVNSNWTERIVGMNDSESDSLLRMLFDHVNTPEFHVRLRWQLGTIAAWEERVTQHRGVADFSGPRKMRRITIPGGPPLAAEPDAFQA